MNQLCAAYHISDANLALRKEFLRLTPADVRVLAKLARWADRLAPTIAREFYDHQFSFGPTLAFFEAYARKRGITLEKLRYHLEQSQAGYFSQVFQEAADGGEFGAAYFEKRLFVGRLHNQIDLPLKWYLGAYVTYTDLFRHHLRRSYLLRPGMRAKAERALATVFNYDMQAICEAFLHDQFQVIGFDMATVRLSDHRHDLSDAYAQVKASLHHSLQTAAGTTTMLSSSSQDLVDRSTQASAMANQSAGGFREVSEAMTALAASVHETLATTEVIASGGQRVATSADRLVETVNDTSAALEQMAHNIREVLGHSETATEAAQQAFSASEAGRGTSQEMQAGMTAIRQTMSTVVTSIENLSRRSEAIDSIIVTIQDIAEQTNMLALNAAIEAARVGDQGKGFAVVAGEVRKLAERTAKATGEISGIVKAIQEETHHAVTATHLGETAIREGEARARSTGDSLESINSAVHHVSSLMTQIHMAMREQSTAATHAEQATGQIQSLASELKDVSHAQAGGTDQIRSAMTVMQTRTQRLTTTVETNAQGNQVATQAIAAIADTAERLNHQSQSLIEAMANFKMAEAAPKEGSRNGKRSGCPVNHG